jgi:hypothetical protein
MRRRRDFIALVGGAAVTWAFATLAQKRQLLGPWPPCVHCRGGPWAEGSIKTGFINKVWGHAPGSLR